MRKIILLLLALQIVLSCQKDKNDDNNKPPPNDTTFIVPKTEDIVIYEVNLRALSASGDFQGVIERLNDIKALGINVIWLMPIHPIGEINSVNSPYSVKDYKQVNPEFGTLSDFKALVKKAHDLEMAVIIDWVANHTAWDNPWISNPDWYTQDGNGNIVHPPGTNWLDVADLNFDSQAMRLEMINSMNYWITETGIDGFRCDAADFIPFDFWQQAISSINLATERELIWLAEGARTDHFTAGFHMNYAWNFYNKLKQVFTSGQVASDLLTMHIMEYNNIPEGKHKLRFTTNHDESAWDATPMVIFNGEKGALAASVIAIYLGGVPLIYGSQEVGVVENVPFFSNSTINWSQHPEMLQAYKSILNFYNSSDALKKGELTSYPSPDVLAFKRAFEQKEVLVLVNVRNNPSAYPVPVELQGTSWKGAFDLSIVTLPEIMSLQAYEYRILTD